MQVQGSNRAFVLKDPPTLPSVYDNAKLEEYCKELQEYRENLAEYCEILRQYTHYSAPSSKCPPLPWG